MEVSQKEYFKAIEDRSEFNQTTREEIKRAYQLGSKLHSGQKRLSGDDYFRGHSCYVSLYLNDLKMGPALLMAGLLHDTIEDTEASKEMLAKECGQEIAELVDGVSRLGDIKYRQYKRHVASLHKFFIAVAKDMRVVLLKLCDRRHNLETLQYLPPQKQRRIAEESMLIHAPLAERLNIGELQRRINDLAFPYAHPQEHQKTISLLTTSLQKAQRLVEAFRARVLNLLTDEFGYSPQIDRRVKGTWSLYKKLAKRDWDISQIYDLIALRVIVKDETDCYLALGLIHQRWRPMLERIKDYIASPKPNGYQSLHTTVFSGQGQVVEIQIKTAAMHHAAEYGISAHLRYKQTQPISLNFDWLTELGQMKVDDYSEGEYLKQLKSDFFSDRLFVFTPQGDVIDLPKGATVLDFAFAVHSDLGLSAKGGLVNGVFKALKTPLGERDVVQIIAGRQIKPNRRWLNWVVTNAAKTRLRGALRSGND